MARRYASLIEFQRRFPDGASCALFLSGRRWPDGFTCRACGGTRSWPLDSRAYAHECRTCGRQTSVTAGTIMHRTKLPLTTWFWAAHLMATRSNGISAQQLMGQPGLGPYKSAWLLAQKLRRSMVDPNRDPLEGVVEVDQTEMPLRSDDDPDTPLKIGKIIVIGAVEVIDRATGKAQRPKALGQTYLDTLSGRIRLAAIPGSHATHIHAFIKADIAPGATVITHGHASCSGMPEYRHDRRVVGAMAAHIPLRWIHRVLALPKRWSLGTYHDLRRQHLAVYLDEFVFRHNRRFHRHVSLETVPGLAAHGSPLSYWDITGRHNPRKNATPTRRNPRRRKTASGMRQDGAVPANVDEPQLPGTTG
jgi:hypothetical protein